MIMATTDHGSFVAQFPHPNHLLGVYVNLLTLHVFKHYKFHVRTSLDPGLSPIFSLERDFIFKGAVWTEKITYPSYVQSRGVFMKIFDSLTSSNDRWRLQSAMILAVAADALQILVFPAFAEGALSPVDDILDLGVAAILVRLLGWHWEFLPAFAIELAPGVDVVPFWTLAVANVYRKWKQNTVSEKTENQSQVIEGEYKAS